MSAAAVMWVPGIIGGALLAAKTTRPEPKDPGLSPMLYGGIGVGSLVAGAYEGLQAGTACSQGFMGAWGHQALAHLGFSLGLGLIAGTIYGSLQPSPSPSH